MKNTKIMLENTKQLNILYVEDDKALIKTMEELFKLFFKSVDIAYDGVEGLASYLDYHVQNDYYYDLVITDINMPNMNGIQMIEKILKLNSEQSIIVTTAHNEMEYITQSINLGVDGFITKPIDTDKLKKVITKTAQSISDRKFVLSYVDTIEDFNIRLDTQNKELLAKNAELEKSFRMLDTMVHKESLSSKALNNNPIVEEHKLQDHIKEQLQSLINDDLFELKEIHEEIDITIIGIINNLSEIESSSSLQELTSHFARYSSVLSFYNFFDELSKAMAVFSSTLQNTPPPEDKELLRDLFMLLESFMYVLGKWQEDISSGDENKINALDASIISDMNTITNMWTQTEEDFSQDDIFDF